MKDEISHELWHKLLQELVSADGFVNYAGFKQNETELDKYLNLLRNNPPQEESSENYKITYWINAYNAFTVKLILMHYGITSIKDIKIAGYDSPWKIPFFTIGKEDFTLDKIEHDILRKNFSEARIHFAIVCASGSCPMLRNEAYDPKQLNEQLENQTNNFLNDQSKNELVGNALILSPILKWYSDDFKNHFENSAELITWLGKYQQNSPEQNASISYKNYDWKLNGK